MSSILIVEDDADIAQLIEHYLRKAGHEVERLSSGSAVMPRLLRRQADLVILDLMLPGMDGYEVLRRLRAHSSVPVLMLTGRGDEPDRIVGLEMGADDYLPKTFSTRELLARLRAVLRRSMATAAQSGDQPVVVGDLTVDPARHMAMLGGEALSLTTGEFDLLLALARAPGRVRTREQLLLEVAERDFEAFDRSIDVHISSLRRKLGDDPRTPRFIETVRGVGYCMKKPEPA